ncbi:DNA polymerase kappa, partial [Haematococcus lacustris]
MPPLDFDLASPEGQAVAQLAGGAWVSQVLCRLWPYSSAAIEQQVQAMVPDLVEANKPPWMEGVTLQRSLLWLTAALLQLDRFSLGATPPVIKSVHVDKV